MGETSEQQVSALTIFSAPILAVKNIVGPQRLHYVSVVNLLVRRDLKVKYRGSFLGYAWSMLNPLLYMAILTFVFSHIVRGIEHYHLYVLSSIMLWTMGSVAISAGTQSIASNAHMLRKIKMPVWVFPFVPLGSSLQNLLLAFGPYLVIHVISGVGFKAEMVLAPVVLVAYAVFIAGISLALSSLNVFFRDIGHVLDPVLALLFYSTPVFYSRFQSEFPERMRHILGLNPFTHFMESWRGCWLPSQPLHFEQLGVCVFFAFLSLSIGGLIYKRAKPKIVFRL
jgi:ABC-type polysaccharide/polyol phosphate export permease